jgi:hypothetical protein
LRRYNPIPAGPNERAEDIDSCIYDGYLKDESDVYVTVTGCASSNNFQVKNHKRKRVNEIIICLVAITLKYRQLDRQRDR